MKTMYKFILLGVVTLSGLFYSCETTELEILDNPNAINPNLADPGLLLNAIQINFVTNMNVFSDRSSDLTRIDYFFGRNYEENLGAGVLDGNWNRFYAGILPDVRIIEALNENPEIDLSYQLAIAKTIEAYQLMLFVDFLGDIPLSEAANADLFPSPNVDDDEVVYTAARALLDEADQFFRTSFGPDGVVDTDDDVPIPGGFTDLFYGGISDPTVRTQSWLRLVNTLKMRHAHTTGNIAEFNTLATAPHITAKEHDFQFTYGTQLLGPNTRHP